MVFEGITGMPNGSLPTWAAAVAPPPSAGGEETRMIRILVLAGLAGLLPLPAAAQPAAQPYAGHAARPIKALSETETADLLAGRGMGLALAAELNDYPGPLHVLELADALGLTEAQRLRTQGLFAAMREEAILRGRELIAREAHLDGLFASRTVSPDTLAAATAAIGAAQAALRATHLGYHIAMRALLTPEQTLRYRELRGYAEASTKPHSHGHGHAHPN